MSVDSGTLTSRSVHPASPVLLHYYRISNETPHVLRVAALIIRATFLWGLERSLSRARHVLHPHLTARYRGQSVTLSHIEIVLALSRLGGLSNQVVSPPTTTKNIVALPLQ